MLTGPEAPDPGEGRICAVLGSPVAHSLSPVLHRTAYAVLGLDWEYQRHQVEADGLARFVAGCDARWRGLSLTMPLKRVALELGEVDPLAATVGAANTLILEPDGTRRVHNTDVDGVVRALRSAGVTAVTRAVVLGSGATARSAIAALAGLGCAELVVLARTPAHAEGLRPLTDTLGLDLSVRPWDADIPDTDVLVATTVPGTADPLADAAAASAPTVFDVLYTPWPTRLAAAATARGRVVLNGLDLLAHQAVVQVELMTGRTVDPAPLLSAGQEALSVRDTP